MARARPPMRLGLLLLGFLAQPGATAGLEMGAGEFQFPILTFPIMLEEKNCLAFSTHHNGTSTRDPAKLGNPQNPLEEKGEKKNCPTKPWERSLDRPTWYGGGELEAGTSPGPDIIYSKSLEPGLRKAVSMSVFEFLMKQQAEDSACLCYHDDTAEDNAGLKCLCKAKGLGKMMDQALPEYLAQQAIVRGEYPSQESKDDAASLLDGYRKELQKLSDATHFGRSNKPSGSGKVASFEKYPANLAMFLTDARDGKLDPTTGLLKGALDFTKHPEANCTSKHMKTEDSFVAVETGRDRALDMVAQMTKHVGVYSAAAQEAAKKEVYDMNGQDAKAGKKKTALPPGGSKLDREMPSAEDPEPPFVAPNKSVALPTPGTPELENLKLETGVPAPYKFVPRLANGPDVSNAAELGDCCSVNPNRTRGCSSKTVTKCVCQHDPFCCEGHWDQTCVRNIHKYKCSLRIGPFGHIGAVGAGCPGVEASIAANDTDVVVADSKSADPSDLTIEGKHSARIPEPVLWCTDMSSGRKFPCKKLTPQTKSKVAERKKKALLAEINKKELSRKKHGDEPLKVDRPVLKAHFGTMHENGTSVVHQRSAVKRLNPNAMPSEHAQAYFALMDTSNSSALKYVGNDGLDEATRASLPPAAGGVFGDCCESHGMMGCSVAAISDCVCSVDDSCCVSSWDAKCVEQVTRMKCAPSACPKPGAYYKEPDMQKAKNTTSV